METKLNLSEPAAGRLRRDESSRLLLRRVLHVLLLLRRVLRKLLLLRHAAHFVLLRGGEHDWRRDDPHGHGRAGDEAQRRPRLQHGAPEEEEQRRDDHRREHQTPRRSQMHTARTAHSAVKQTHRKKKVRQNKAEKV